MTPEQQLEKITYGCETLIGQEDLLAKLKSGKKLIIKAGFDPTAPDLHLGHLVMINKLKDFQELGHEVVFLIGDFTALVGDPTGKSATRKPLSQEQIRENAKTYSSQIFLILEQAKTRLAFNSEWLGELNLQDILKLTASQSVARMLERDDFAKRYQANQSIALHEFLYPLLQGYDSVALKADVELGGTDQTFNLLVGRDLQRLYGQASQSVLTLPLLEGLDGVQKMSKSLGNYVALLDSAEDMFGKIMSLPDKMILQYAKLIMRYPQEELIDMQDKMQQGFNPMAFKLDLASRLVARFKSQEEALRAQGFFRNRFQNKSQAATTAKEVEKTCAEAIGILSLLVSLEAAKSNSQAMQLIKQGAVKIDGQKITDSRKVFGESTSFLLQVGKHHIIRLDLQIGDRDAW